MPGIAQNKQKTNYFFYYSKNNNNKNNVNIQIKKNDFSLVTKFAFTIIEPILKLSSGFSTIRSLTAHFTFQKV